jgi:phosphoribosyl 1,2-cyclic phosphate phosphodiesterase
MGQEPKKHPCKVAGDLASIGPSFSVIVLGSGTSQGVPLIGCTCRVCTSPDPRDRRFRASVWVGDGKEGYLVDTAPELRLQCLREGIRQVNAVLYTHGHADHIMGFDDLRRFCELAGKPMPIFGLKETLETLRRIFPYAFFASPVPTGYVQAVPQVVERAFELGSFRVRPLPVIHGQIPTVGYLFERNGRKLFAYIPDCHSLTEEAWTEASGVEVLMIDGLRDEPHPTHLTPREALEIAERLGVAQTFLTHITHHASHAERSSRLPKRAEVAYDGLRLRWTDSPGCLRVWGPVWGETEGSL